MTDEITLAKLKKVINCLGELLTIKRAMGHVDIRSLLSDQPDTPMKLAKKPKSTKHYNHYSRGTSSGCGGSDDSYSDSCGGSSSRTSRC